MERACRVKERYWRGRNVNWIFAPDLLRRMTAVMVDAPCIVIEDAFEENQACRGFV